MTPTIVRLLREAEELLPAYRQAIADMPRETEHRGICASEMFFFYVAVRPLAPRQILESGRMRGESTLALALCFPQTAVVSVEFDAAAPDAAIALAKLKPHANVECLFGDSRRVFPERLQQGDVVLIDGPKEFRALKLALKLLRTGKPSAIFLHDFMAGRPERVFLERHWPGAFFSDDPEFRERFAVLDDDGSGSLKWKRARHSTFACLPGRLPRPYWLLRAHVTFARTASLAPSKIGAILARLGIRKTGASDGSIAPP